jgi:hypothetical protein
MKQKVNPVRRSLEDLSTLTGWHGGIKPQVRSHKEITFIPAATNGVF